MTCRYMFALPGEQNVALILAQSGGELAKHFCEATAGSWMGMRLPALRAGCRCKAVPDDFGSLGPKQCHVIRDGEQTQLCKHGSWVGEVWGRGPSTVTRSVCLHNNYVCCREAWALNKADSRDSFFFTPDHHILQT